MEYSMHVTFKDRKGCVSTITVGSCDTIDQAEQRVWQWAYELGYTYPKWWQFWRLNEQKPPQSLLSLLNSEVI